MSARSIMVLGTSSHVGKSLLTAALCRIFAQQGNRVAPFKSQNMSLNSAATVEGLEIGRAQALQAEAAGIPPSVNMNPILLKPAGDRTSQIVVRGKIWGRLTASEYHRRRVEELLPIVQKSYEALAAENEVIVLEGAGSPAEINLKQHDIVNMRMAEMADAKCILVGDIDRGGVFASLLGTVELLDRHERERICGFVINKFRGDVKLLEPGIRMMEDRLGIPCLGVLPYLSGLALDEEDSLGLPADSRNAPWQPSSDLARQLRIAVIASPSFSNFTDFDALQAEPSVDLRFCRSAAQLLHADLVILPGSKQTVDDLQWLRSVELDQAILNHAESGLIVGICGGMQMLGESIADPECVEHEGLVAGLSLLPIKTTMRPVKITANATGELVSKTLFGKRLHDVSLRGYEIHVGETEYQQDAKPLLKISRQRGSDREQCDDGCVAASGRVIGTYLHGIFDEDNFRHEFLRGARASHHLTAAAEFAGWREQREQSLNRLASTVEQALDMDTVFRWVSANYRQSLSSAAESIIL